MTFTLVATAKNEGPYLLEWVAYHRMIGFDNILLFQNDSDDLTHETMRVLRDIGAAEYRYNDAPVGRHQVRAYKRAARQPAFREADFAIALDLDEFLQVNVGNGHLKDLMRALPKDTDEILLNWRRFGHSGQVEISDALVTERFMMAEPTDRVAERLTPYKSMFRPDHFQRAGIHQPDGLKVDRGALVTRNGSGLAEPDFTRHRFRCTDPGVRKLAQINHYIVRDAAGFVLKSYRGSAHQAHRDISRKYWKKRNFNDELDLGLSTQNEETRASMAMLDAMSGGRLEELRLASVQLHQDRFARLMDEPEFRDLYEFCTAA